MIQILGLRQFTNEKGELIRYDAFMEKNWKAKNHQELFDNLDKHIEAIPEEERWNIFYTIAHCGAQKREFSTQNILAFDYDGIDTSRLDEYIDIILEVLEVPREKATAIFSGNGLHVLIQMKNAYNNKAWFKENRPQYKGILNRINQVLFEKELPGAGDPAVFDPRRILRLPGTVNRKPGKEEKTCKILFHNLSTVDIDMEALAKLPKPPTLKKSDALSKKMMANYQAASVTPIREQCGFIDWVYKNPGEVSEPSWYAALSIVARTKEGKEECHRMSAGHPKYSAMETELKIEQALESSGPRTCSGIAESEPMCQACSKCPIRDQITSPIQIRDKEEIRTESTGFHTVKMDKNGNTSLTPNPHDLVKYYQREFHFKTMEGTRECYKWTGTHYKMVSDSVLEEFAYRTYKPLVKMAPMREFREMVTATNNTDPDWFQDTCRRKLNLKNGVFDLDEGKLIPHTPDNGFLHVLPYDYVPGAKCPRFETMLEKITMSNGAVKDILLEFIAYALSGDSCWAQKALVLVGGGANGKSTLANVIEALMGKDNCTGFTMPELQESEYNRAMIKGKLLNISEETPAKSVADSTLFKAMIGGAKIAGRLPYKNGLRWRNDTKMMFLCNELPGSTDTSYGFYRRFIILRFNQHFTKSDPDYDPHIEEKLLMELPGILNLVLKAYKRLKYQRGFTSCQTSAKELREYKKDTDGVLRWFEDNTRVVANRKSPEYKTKRVSTKVLYDDYKELMVQEVIRPIVSHVKFTRRLKDMIKEIDGDDKRFKVAKIDGVAANAVFGIEYGEGIGKKIDPEDDLEDAPGGVEEDRQGAEGVEASVVGGDAQEDSGGSQGVSKMEEDAQAFVNLMRSEDKTET